MLGQVIQCELSDGRIAAYKHYEKVRNSTKDPDIRYTAMYPIDEETAFTVSLYGRSDVGKDFCCHVTGFQPYLEIRIDVESSVPAVNRIDHARTLWDQSGKGEKLLQALQKKMCAKSQSQSQDNGSDEENQGNGGTGEKGKWKKYPEFVSFGELQEMKSNYGFRNGEKDIIVPVRCKNLWAYQKVKYLLQELGQKENVQATDLYFTLINKDVDPTTRFWGDSSLSGAKPCGWYDFPDEIIGGNNGFQTLCDVEFEILYSDFIKTTREDIVQLNPHFVQLTFDIETYTADRKSGGINPLLLENPCFSIGFTLFSNGKFTHKYLYYYSESFTEEELQTEYTHLINQKGFHLDELGKKEKETKSESDSKGDKKKEDLEIEPNTIIKLFKTEKSMLETFGATFKDIRPNVLLGYNSEQFDIWYLFERAKLLKCNNNFYEMSKVKGVECFYREENFSSAARGDAQFRRPTIPGVFSLDVLIVVAADVTKKYPSYTLKYVAKEILKGETKYDLDYAQMFALYEAAMVQGAAEIAHYCLQDVVVTQKVGTVDVMVNKLVEMSNLMLVDISWLITKGQTVKCISSLYAYYRKPKYNYYFDIIYEKADKLGGGHVEEPKRGFYQSPTVVLDFKSLYPSIMVGRKLDFSSCVRDPKYLNLPGVNYFTSRFVHPTTGAMMEYTFAHKPNSDIHHVIPDILANLSSERQAVKKLMKGVKDKHSAEYAALDSKQNAIKVSMNSFFGFVGGFKFPFEPYAQTITGEGRNMLTQSKLLVETGLPASILAIIPRLPVVIYGDTDSVFVNCPEATEAQAEAFGKAAGDFLTETFDCAPIEMEYEKTLLQLVLINPKNYVYTVRKANGEIEVIYFGGEQVKRDYCDYFHSIYDQIANNIFDETKVDEDSNDSELELTSKLTLELKIQSHLDFPQYVKTQKDSSKQILETLIILGRKEKKVDDDCPSLQSRVQQELPNARATKLCDNIRLKLNYLQFQSPDFQLKKDLQQKKIQKKITSSLQMVSDAVVAIQNKEIDLKTLCETKRLAAKYDSRPLAKANGVEKASIAPYDDKEWAIPNMPQVKLARRIKQRAPGEEPSIGERFSFLKVTDTSRMDTKSEQVETLEYVLANDIPIDIVAYLTKDGKPFQKLFAVLGAGLVCGELIDKFAHQATQELNAVVLKEKAQLEKHAKANFFQIGSSSNNNNIKSTKPNETKALEKQNSNSTKMVFQTRKVKASAASKSIKTTKSVIETEKQQTFMKNFFTK